MFVVTFYSYKGGVGRTLALVNCAFQLARQGKKVFILDFDLEAPGIDAFRLCTKGESQKGIVEYISRFTTGGSIEPLRDYVCEVNAESCSPGTIHFMPAGRKDEEYQVALSRLDWKSFYREQDGFFFVENLKGSIEKEYAPDYVLIDSRTGLTDVSGICTLQLPDLVVLVFNLNNQNVLGIRRIYRSIRRNRLNKTIRTLLVASPIPEVLGYSDLRDRRLKYAQETLEVENIDMTVPFDALVTFEETVLTPRELSSPLGRSYVRLSEIIRKANSADILTMLEDASRRVQAGDIEAAELDYEKIMELHPNDARALTEYAKFLSIRRDNNAIRYLERALELRPNDSDVMGRLIRANLNMGKPNKAESYVGRFAQIVQDTHELEEIGSAFELKGIIEPARQLYEKAVQLGKPPRRGPHLDLGNLYVALKKPELAAEQFQMELDDDPTSLAATYNFAHALSLCADARSNEWFQRAVILYEQRPRELSSMGGANVLQAMSNAYAAVGKKKKAIELLTRAIRTAAKSARSKRHFSSVQYKYIPRDEFLSESRLLMRKLTPARAKRKAASKSTP